MKSVKGMKKLISLVVMTCMLLVLLAACGGGSKPAETKKSEPAPASAASSAPAASSTSKPQVKYPSKPITMIVPYAAGGSTDIGARLLAAEAEKILGQPISIVNTPGGGGWIGWNDLLKAEKDGYTIAHLNDFALISGYLDPQQKRKNTLADFVPIVCHVIDYSTISISPKETRFKDFKELIEYAKTHEVTITSTGPQSDEFQAMLKINKELGTKFIPIHNKGASESLTAIMGGHVDVMFGNVGDTKVPVDNKQVKCVAVLAPERSDFLKDVPTMKEVTGKEILGFSSRGIGAAAGVDKAVIDVLLDAFKKAADSPTFKAKMAEQGLESKNVVGNAYMEMLKKEEAELKEFAPLFGWK